ncbi:hypothetical protein ES319_D01G110800v1 [Gossypium barbadense]|uniref:Uncharacterized protein LOC107921775 isoform X5 n=2 Tax=Gossypium TaxID=3633 RepID=A0A1U8N9F4_GOSHI|nr:uncharacterized protein LOC107921775 isoform X4 [Gossypium hirsutum]XP_016735731.2 uncharacterized protein LOC107946058 isoform X4 [Gossypium hirsutum]XP_040943115.1 uncharacterized protein LOC107921775 isoform X4 [Gossypium hirsutum]XP_040962770.1 uncharacterized protein LOC107946058 isoform X4 [Gossypium hirsutum]KAB2044733.1 hypothetical protein ES319_D01G110800v1 [Gossypium barbadense]
MQWKCFVGLSKEFSPIRGSSINRYLQWKSGKVWSKSFSAGDDSCNSCSELEDGKSHERSGQETNQQMCNYKYQLEQEVKKLQQQLQEETDLHLALASAVEHFGSPSSSSPGKLPDKQALHQGLC